MTAGQFFFKYRSYTAIIPAIPALLLARPTLLTLIIGVLIILPGELMRIWGVSYAGGETRTTKVGASVLVTQGPFAYLRNPLYLGNLLIYFGIGIMSNALFPYLQIIGPVYFYILYYYIIKEEEGFLKNKYKEKFDDYYKSVNKFVPRTTPYEPSKQSKVKKDLNTAYKSEKRTFQSAFIMILMIVLIYILINQ